MIGAGAIGAYFLWGMRELPREDICLIAKGERKERLIRNGIIINGERYDYPVKVYVTEEKFPAKTYGDLTFPEGTYQALRIDIGKAEGQNWWCVMFPALCLPSAEGNELQNELPDSEKCIVDNNENSNGYEIRFGVVEAVSSFSDWLCSLF